MAGLLSGALGGDPKGDILERIYQICRNMKVFTYKCIFDIMRIQLFLSLKFVKEIISLLLTSFFKPWILLTVNGLNATYIIWREGKFTGADVGIIGEHQSPLVIRMGETQGMAKLMSSNEEQVEPLKNGWTEEISLILVCRWLI